MTDTPKVDRVALAHVLELHLLSCSTVAAGSIHTAAAELRKTCAGCRHWRQAGSGFVAMCDYYNLDVYDGMLPDGTGYCHRWEAK